MSKIQTLRSVVYTVLDGAERRALNFVGALEGVVRSFISNVLDAGRAAIFQGLRIVVGLVETVIEEAFTLARSTVELAIGEEPPADVDEVPAPFAVMGPAMDEDEEESD